jgi:hypothetical protein
MRFTCFLAAVVSGLVFASSVEAGSGRPYYYDQRASTASSSPYFFVFKPAIDNAGNVVFMAWERANASGEGLFSGPNPATDTVVRVPGAYTDLRAWTKNGAGTVGFTAYAPGISGSGFVGPNPATDDLMPVRAPVGLLGIGSISLNNSNQSVIKGTYVPLSGNQRDVLIATHNGVGRVVAKAVIGPGIRYLPDGLVNNSGTVIFTAAQAGGDGDVNYQAIEGGPIQTTPYSDQGFSFPDAPYGIFDIMDANDSGAAVFAATKLISSSTGVDSVFVAPSLTSTQAELIEIANAVGPMRDLGYPAINNSGTVAFQAGIDDQPFRGIYTGPDPERDAVVRPGDSLFGHTVQETFFIRDGLNDAGQVAFNFSTVNGPDFVAVATPATFGDANLDRAVNLEDFNTLAANFGLSGMTWSQADFTGDGNVNLADFNMLAAHFGEQAGAGGPTPDDWAALAAAVPEPACGGAALLAVGALLRVRRCRSTPRVALRRRPTGFSTFVGPVGR